MKFLRGYIYMLAIPIFFVSVCRANGYTKQQTPAEQYCAALFQYYNETGMPNMDILQFSLREKLFQELKKYGYVHLIDQATLNERVINRDLDILDNLNRPRIMQYIGGLLNADIIIFGTYKLDNGAIVVSTHLVDATEGKPIKNYLLSGQISQIDLIVQRIAEQIVEDIETWKRMGGFAGSQNMAHHLGKLVAEAERSDPQLKTLAKSGKKQNILHVISARKIIQSLSFAKLRTVSTVFTECGAILRRSPRESVVAEMIGTVYLMHALGALYSNDMQQAKLHFSDTLVFFSDNDSVLCSIADAYSSIKAYTEATEVYTKCIQKNPENINAYKGIANVYIKKQEYVLAGFFLSQALVKSPQDRELYIMLADSYALNNRGQKAVETLKDGLRLFPDDMEMGKLLIHYYRTFMPAHQQTDLTDPLLKPE